MDDLFEDVKERYTKSLNENGSSKVEAMSMAMENLNFLPLVINPHIDGSTKIYELVYDFFRKEDPDAFWQWLAFKKPRMRGSDEVVKLKTIWGERSVISLMSEEALQEMIREM